MVIQLRTLAWDDLMKTGDWSSGRGWSFSGPHGRRSSVLFSSECRRGLGVTYLPLPGQGSRLVASGTDLLRLSADGSAVAVADSWHL